MDNLCTICAANGICPYYGFVDGYSAHCDDVLAQLTDNFRGSYYRAWDSYVQEDEDIDFNHVQSSLL